MGRNHKQTINKVIGAAMLAALASTPASAASLDPDVCATEWTEGGKACASVSLNGKELITYKGTTTAGEAGRRAEELADDLQEMLDKKRDLVDQLLPSREGNVATIKANGETLLSFPAEGTSLDENASQANPLEKAFNIVNAIRSAVGGTILPANVLKFADVINNGKNALAKAGGACFSGKASWYGAKFHGRKAANGERFDMEGLTAAHRTLPFGTKLLVMNRKTGNSCVVEVNDRGPYVGNRVIDLSMGAAKKLNMISSGVATVDVLVLGN